MKSRKQAAALGVLALACAPVTAASAATVLFSDNFDTAASAARYDQFIFDRGNGNDGKATFEGLTPGPCRVTVRRSLETIVERELMLAPGRNAELAFTVQ